MARVVAIVGGSLLAIIWVAGLASESTAWLTWIDGAAALLSLGMAAVLRSDTPPARASMAPVALGTLTFGLWIAGLASNAAGWQTWLNFIAGCTYVVGAILIVSQRSPAYHGI